MTLDTLAHLGEALAIVVTGFKVVGKMNRILSILMDFPPHQHVNGKIIYPKGYAPEQISRLD